MTDCPLSHASPARTRFLPSPHPPVLPDICALPVAGITVEVIRRPARVPPPHMPQQASISSLLSRNPGGAEGMHQGGLGQRRHSRCIRANVPQEQNLSLLSSAYILAADTIQPTNLSKLNSCLFNCRCIHGYIHGYIHGCVHGYIYGYIRPARHPP